MKNLKEEGLSKKAINTGDIMFDAVKRNLKLAEKKSDIINKLKLNPEKYFLTTLHRPYNVDNKEVLNNIMQAFAQIDDKIVFAVHPRTLKNLKQFCIKIPSNIISTEPLGYFDFLLLQRNAIKIITDSGGIQKEAFFIQKPCITLRPETEWVETIYCKANTLVPSRNKEDILKAIYDNKKADFTKYIYGNGNSAEIILKNIINFPILQ